MLRKMYKCGTKNLGPKIEIEYNKKAAQTLKFNNSLVVIRKREVACYSSWFFFTVIQKMLISSPIDGSVLHQSVKLLKLDNSPKSASSLTLRSSLLLWYNVVPSVDKKLNYS